MRRRSVDSFPGILNVKIIIFENLVIIDSIHLVVHMKQLKR
jgi:hypothetical protein